MKKYSKYSALFIMLLVAITYSAPSLVGETDSKTVVTDNSDFSANLELTALDSATISENASYDLFTLLNVNAKRIDSEGVITSLIDKVTYETDLDPMIPGTYPVKFSVVDDLTGAVAEKSSVVYVENIEPTLEVTNPVVTVMEGEEVNYVSDFGAVATEFSSGDLTANIQVIDTVDTSVAGTYPVSLEVTDEEGAVATRTASVQVQSYKPTITANDVEYYEDQEVTKSLIMSDAMVKAVDHNGYPVGGEWIEAPKGFDYNNLEPGTYTFKAKVIYGFNMAETTFTVTIKEALPVLEPAIETPVKNYDINVGDPIPMLSDLLMWFEPYTVDFTTENPEIMFEFGNQETEFSTAKPKDYPLYFYAYDGETLIESGEVNLHVKKGNNKAPEIMVAEVEKTIDEVAGLDDDYDNDILEIFDPSATDKEDEDSTLMFSLDYDRENFSTDKPGTYSIQIIVTDSEGATDSIMVTLHIRDLLPTLTSTETELTITLGDAVDYIDDFGVSATEKMSGDLTSAIMVHEPTITGPGTYMVKYEVMDEEGNYAQPLNLTLIVEEPFNNPPVITGLEEVTIYETDKLINLRQLFNIKVTDVEDDADLGDELKTKVTIKSGPLRAKTPGEYFIQIEATDSGGKKAYFTGTLYILDVLPKITTDIDNLGVDFESEPLTREDFIELYGIHATEFKLDDIIESLEVNSEEVMYDQAGMYPVYLTARDEEKNIDTYTIYVVVGEPPLEIGISSKRYARIPEEIAVSREELIDLYDMVASTSLFEQINEYITITGSFNVDKPDVYDLKIVVEYMDLYKEFDIQLEVVDSLPEIGATLDSITIKDTDKLKDLISRFGIHASEIYDGDLTNDVMVDTSNVMMKDGKLIPGSYPVVFTAVDEEGNEAMVTTALNVEDTSEEETEVDSEDDTEVDSEDDTEVDTDDDTEVDTEDDTEVDTEGDTDVDSEVDTEDDMDAESEASSTGVMTLAQTGAYISATLVILGFALVIIVMVRASIANSRK